MPGSSEPPEGGGEATRPNTRFIVKQASYEEACKARDEALEEVRNLRAAKEGLEQEKKELESKVATLTQTVEGLEGRVLARVRQMMEEFSAGKAAEAPENGRPSSNSPNSPPVAPLAANHEAFPPLGTNNTSIHSSSSYKAVAARTPPSKPITRQEYHVFHLPPPSQLPPPSLSPSLSDHDLRDSIDRFYIDDIQAMPISDLKKILRNRNIPLNHILSLDYVGSYARFGIRRSLLEVMCYKKSSEMLKREFIQRWGVKILKDFSPMIASNQNAGMEVKKMILQRYRERMLRHANREEDRDQIRRRIFGIYYLTAGGDKDKLKKIGGAGEAQGGGEIQGEAGLQLPAQGEIIGSQ
ncbi:hypothetical protein JCM5353_007916 [Sporobolomyces roseus]